MPKDLIILAENKKVSQKKKDQNILRIPKTEKTKIIFTKQASSKIIYYIKQKDTQNKINVKKIIQ